MCLVYKGENKDNIHVFVNAEIDAVFWGILCCVQSQLLQN